MSSKCKAIQKKFIKEIVDDYKKKLPSSFPFVHDPPIYVGGGEPVQSMCSL